jgi:hypothetical protein
MPRPVRAIEALSEWRGLSRAFLLLVGMGGSFLSAYTGQYLGEGWVYWTQLQPFCFLQTVVFLNCYP